jgi:spore coat polysaccharide biosynthesis protein SpsF (cytidylyltransferase family)
MGQLGDTAIIINSRPNSSRVPRKVFYEFDTTKEKVTMLGALIYRLHKTGIPIILAIPEGTRDQYAQYKDVFFFEGYYSDPLKRMSEAAKVYNISNVIRVCHDKVFVDDRLINRGLQIFKNMQVDYLFSSFFIDGSGFEIIKASTVHLACSLHKDVEHISYAVKTVTKNVFNWPIPTSERSEYRILADTMRDMGVIEAIFKRFKTKTLVTPLQRVIEFLRIHPEITCLNQPPILTIYTCCYNGERYLKECLESIIRQKGFEEYEYIFINDASTDDTENIILYYVNEYPNIRYYKNDRNLGLASSSNVALEKSRGKYITRLDADDYYSSKTSCLELINSIRHSDMEAIYPSNFYGSKDVTQSAEENHHIGGAIFNRRSINDIKFTGGLKGYEGLDFFHRAMHLLRIGYLANPVFFYRQHNTSMSKTNLKKREKIKKGIINGSKQKMA